MPEQYETELARYLEQRIKPNLSQSAIPLMARSIAKELAKKQPSQDSNGGDQASPRESPADFEAEMHELQQELGESWILRFSVKEKKGWLTAESEDGSQRVEAPNAASLVQIVEAINEGGGRQS